MRKFKFAALAALSSFALSGCATADQRQQSSYKIKTDPVSAKICQQRPVVQIALALKGTSAAGTSGPMSRRRATSRPTS